MTTQNWPDPTRPGVPLFPERDGWHHVGRNLLFWHSDIQKWVTESTIRGCKEPEDFAGDEYHGTVLTPTQINEMLAAEQEHIKKMVGRACDLGNLITPRQRDAIVAGIDVDAAIRNMAVAP